MLMVLLMYFFLQSVKCLKVINFLNNTLCFENSLSHCILKYDREGILVGTFNYII